MDEDEPLIIIDDPHGKLPADPPEESPTFRSFVEATFGDLRSGAMWAGWTPDGRPAYGDSDDEQPEGVDLVEHDLDRAAMAGIIVTNLIDRQVQVQQPTPDFRPMNREERRARDRANLRTRRTGRR